MTGQEIPVEFTLAKDGTINCRVLPGPGTDAEAIAALEKLIRDLTGAGVKITVEKAPETHRHTGEVLLERNRATNTSSQSR